MPAHRIIDLDIQPLPGPRLRVLQLLPRADVELGELVSIVETDPALTMTMLRLANSASSAPGRRIGTARAAVIRAGALLTKRAVAGAVLHGAFHEAPATALDMDEFWRHSLATALLADAIAMRGGGRTEAFTAGLLHDIGCVAMASVEPERYQRVLQLVRQGVAEEDAERIMFGYTHSYYGMRIAERWELSQVIVDAIEDHHAGTMNEVAAATARARGVALRAGIGDGRGTPSTFETQFEVADRTVLHSVRGVDGLHAQISAFREAMGGGAKPGKASAAV